MTPWRRSDRTRRQRRSHPEATCKAAAGGRGRSPQGAKRRTKQEAEMAAANRKRRMTSPREEHRGAGRSVEEHERELRDRETSPRRNARRLEKPGGLERTFTVSGNRFEGTMTIESRVKDKLKGHCLQTSGERARFRSRHRERDIGQAHATDGNRHQTLRVRLPASREVVFRTASHV